MSICINDIIQKKFYNVYTDWFSNDFINLMNPTVIYIFFLSMTSCGDYHRLNQFFLFNKTSYAISCIIAVHDWHATVHKDKSI